MIKKIVVVASVGLLAIMTAYFFIGRPIFRTNVALSKEKQSIFIPSGASFEDVLQILRDSAILQDEASFISTAKWMKYNKSQVPSGRYDIVNGMTNKALVAKLRSGDQDSQNVVINNIRQLKDLAGKAGRYFEVDSSAFLTYLSDPKTASQYGFTTDNFLTMFIPNSYKMFWNATPEKFVARMKKEYDRFWTDAYIQKVKQLNLTQTQAYIVASIVEKESNYDAERPTIAGVYLNRLKVGEKLQADPTVVYALGDFNIQRVLYSHLEVDSPYNTYKYAGLPPGPICMPSIASLEAVIHAEQHDYMFFCAKADNSGIHVFAKSYEEHLKNADAFAKWLNERNIK